MDRAEVPVIRRSRLVMPDKPRSSQDYIQSTTDVFWRSIALPIRTNIYHERVCCLRSPFRRLSVERRQGPELHTLIHLVFECTHKAMPPSTQPIPIHVSEGVSKYPMSGVDSEQTS